MTAVRTAETITALDVFLNSAKVGTIVRTPGDFNAFSLDPAYRATGGIPVLSLSLRAASGGLRKDPRPVAGSLPPFLGYSWFIDPPAPPLNVRMVKHTGSQGGFRAFHLSIPEKEVLYVALFNRPVDVEELMEKGLALLEQYDWLDRKM